MTTSLIITTYNWVEALELVFLSILQQSILPDEVIVADDGSSIKTKKLIEKYQDFFPIELHHFWQEDDGFRAASARNGAIRMSQGSYLILIDGDMVLHPLFVEDHLSFAKEGAFLQGSRVLIDKEKTLEIIYSKKITFSFYQKGLSNRKNAIHMKCLASLCSGYRSTIQGIKSCNFSLHRTDAYKVNGFNEAFVGWGREDSEFAVRLMNAGIKRRDLKFHAIAYHLYHPENTRKSLPQNDEKLQSAIDKKMVWCTEGLQ